MYNIVSTDLSNPDKTEAPFCITRLQCKQNNPINALFKKEIQSFICLLFQYIEISLNRISANQMFYHIIFVLEKIGILTSCHTSKNKDGQYSGTKSCLSVHPLPETFFCSIAHNFSPSKNIYPKKTSTACIPRGQRNCFASHDKYPHSYPNSFKYLASSTLAASRSLRMLCSGW